MTIKYVIPDYISSRVYDLKNRFIAYVSNEKTHEFYSWEGLSAELWKLLLERKTKESFVIFPVNFASEDILDFAKKYDVVDSLESFFIDLKKIGLIVPENYIDTFSCSTLGANNYQTNKKLMDFQNEMRLMTDSVGVLRSLFIELTYKCNLKCVHCFNDKDDLIKQITFEEIKPIIDDAYKLGVFNITLSGGECSVCNDFLKIAEYIRSKRISLEIYTNAQNLYDNPNLLEQIIRLYPIRIGVSLYSMDPEVHDSITGVQGSQVKTVSVIKKLRENNINVEVKCFVLKNNYNDFEDVLKFSREIGADCNLDCKFLNNESRQNSHVKLSDAQIYNFYVKQFEYNENYKIRNEINDSYLNEVICEAGISAVAVDPFLNIFPCVCFKRSMGNANDTSLLEIWNNRYLYSQEKKKLLKNCFTEEHCEYCMYCRGISDYDNDYLGNCETSCTHAKAQMNAVKKLEENIKS